MIDLVKLHLIAGNGGDGRISFRRAKYIPKGGPDGGNGGNGGNVIVRGSKNLTTLQDLTGLKEIKAQHGQAGGKQKRMGAKGEDIVIEVPVGTVVWLLAENEASRKRHQRYGVNYLLGRDEIDLEIYEVPEGSGIPPRDYDQVRPILEEESVSSLEEQDEDTAAVLKREARLLKKTINSSSDRLAETDFRQLPKQQVVEITADGQEVTICQGGFGGHGNTSFKGPSRTTPRLAEFGSFGEHKVVVLEQRLLADIGLVGFPSVGKSTLLSVLTGARPKIAAYPFTTLEPHLGVMRVEDRELIVADLPGLIEGAHEGKGLGYAFLRHVEHCQKLLVVVSLEENVIFDQELSAEEKAKVLVHQYQELQAELKQYNELLLEKEQLLGVSKADLYDAELREAITKAFTKQQPLFFSAATTEGIAELQHRLIQQPE